MKNIISCILLLFSGLSCIGQFDTIKGEHIDEKTICGKYLEFRDGIQLRFELKTNKKFVFEMTPMEGGGSDFIYGKWKVKNDTLIISTKYFISYYVFSDSCLYPIGSEPANAGLYGYPFCQVKEYPPVPEYAYYGYGYKKWDALISFFTGGTKNVFMTVDLNKDSTYTLTFEWAACPEGYYYYEDSGKYILKNGFVCLYSSKPNKTNEENYFKKNRMRYKFSGRKGYRFKFKTTSYIKYDKNMRGKVN